MKKFALYMTVLMVLIVPSLFGSLGGRDFSSSGSVVAAAFFQEATPTPTLAPTPTPTLAPTPTPTLARTPAPILTIVKEMEATLINDLDGDGVIDPGDTIKYVITYENIGNGQATNVAIVDDYDQTLIVSIANISADGRDDGDIITWNLGTVEAGAKGSVSYNATLNISFPAGSIDVMNTATICSEETDPVRTARSAPVKGPILTIDKAVAPGVVSDLDGDGVIDPGDTIKYVITYENIGNGQATHVAIVDDYDETLIVSIANISADGRDDGDIITWNLGTVEAGAKGSVSYHATLKLSFPAGSIDVMNTATINSEETDPVTTTRSTLVKGPILTIDKRVVKDLDGDGVIDPGDTIEYVIAYQNIGDGQATNVAIVDDYDETLIVSIANISADGRHDGDIITWNLGTVEAGAKGSVSYNATLKPVFDLGPNAVENKATIKGDRVEPVSDEAYVLVEVIPTPTPTPSVIPGPTATPATGQFKPTKAQGEGPLGATQITILLALLLCGGLLVIGVMACRTLKDTTADDGEKLIRSFIEGVALVVIFFTILVLALHNAIEPDGIISIVSAIVGYILGRRAGA